MTQVLLIRHGQARFASDDYDRLSSLGERQARLVGRHLSRTGAPLDRVLAGDMQRQTHTARLAIAHWCDPPELVRDPAFNEYDADALFAAYLPRVLDENPALAEQRDSLFSDRRVFQKAFERVTAHWLAGTGSDTATCEAWSQFTARVTAALTRLREQYPRDSRIGVFTSGGPIAVAAATAVEASAAKTIELNWSIYNAAVTRLRATRGGWRLTGFNDVSALQAAGDPALITYR